MKVVLIILIVLYFVQLLIIIFKFLEDMTMGFLHQNFNTKKELLLWSIPFYMAILAVIKHFNKLY